MTSKLELPGRLHRGLRKMLQNLLSGELSISISQRQADNIMRIPATLLGLTIAAFLLIHLAITTTESIAEPEMTPETAIQLQHCDSAGSYWEVADCRSRILNP